MEPLSPHASRPAPAAYPLQKTKGRQLHLVWLYRLVRFALGILFVWSGWAKLMDSQGFAAIIEAYGLIPPATVLPAAMLLSLLEILAGAGLIFDLQWSLAIMAGLLSFFMAILGYGLWLGLDVDCGCFGPDDPEGRAYHGLRPALYRDMVMLVGIGYLFLWRHRQSARPVRLSVMHQILLNMRRRK
jgi:uncharacterized membrane protein YphA (DoxX/SURF4 family)